MIAIACTLITYKSIIKQTVFSQLSRTTEAIGEQIFRFRFRMCSKSSSILVALSTRLSGGLRPLSPSACSNRGMEAISFSPLKPSCPFVRAVVTCVLQVASVDVGDGGGDFLKMLSI